MSAKHTFLLPLLMLVIGVMAIAGSLLMQEWQIQQDAQEYEMLVQEARATVMPALDKPLQTETLAAVIPSDTPVLPPVTFASNAPIPSALPSAMEPTIEPTAVPQQETLWDGSASASGSSSSIGVDLAACKATNSDFIAWLHIPGTKIDYPVVLTDDVEYYLTHTFAGKESSIGTLFSLGRTDYRIPSRNIAIFGHHMRRSRSQTMFQPLHNYKDSSFYHKHSTITLDSLYRSTTYTIFAVLNMCESDWDASTADFSTDEAFLAFVERAKALAFYETGVSVGSDDHILTLITCDRDYHSTEGRLIVMAVQQ